MLTLRDLRVIRRRRSELARVFDVEERFQDLEESCVPSYCHRNRLAAAVAWMRLVVARDLYRRVATPGAVLDFGAGTGELSHLLGSVESYHFLESSDLLSEVLARFVPDARRQDLATLPEASFATIFALDALEHNRDVSALIDSLTGALEEGGHLILSGPTENRLYRIARHLAGFTGHYHHTTIYAIERDVARRLRRIALRKVPPVVPLFRLSVWG
jgi:2-polyprenyl-3-methyl-5-hydroxy-6-metoxy-1,4-benzoquinol methylase